MGRLIEVQDALSIRKDLTVRIGDVLMFSASGGRVRSGQEAVELLGLFAPAVLGGNEEVLSPAAAPNTALFLAFSAGRATIDVVMGDPWHSHQTATLSVIVEP